MPSPYKAYSRASHTVSKPRQVVMLFEGAIRFLQQAAEAMDKDDPHLRYEKLARANEVIIALQSALDLANGGEQARGLHDFYNSIEARIRALHRSSNADACDQIVAELREMRDIWDTLDRQDG